MSAYVITFIWLLSHIICFYLAKKRQVKPNLFHKIVAVILGPLAIPLVFALKPNQSVSSH